MSKSENLRHIVSDASDTQMIFVSTITVGILKLMIDKMYASVVEVYKIILYKILLRTL